MVGHELAIEQFKPAQSKPCDQPRQGNLRRVSFAREHAFPEKRAPQSQPVKSAHEATFRPAFDAMCPPLLVQAAESLFDIWINSGVASIRLRFGTFGNDLRKSGVGSDHKPILPDSFGKRL
jgi:hypothetical protein